MTAGTNTSRTYDFAPSLADVVITAYGRCGIRRSAITPEHLHDAAMEANLLQADWSNQQVNLWTVDLQSIPLVPGQAKYDVDPATVMILGSYIATGNAPEKDRLITSVDRDTYAAFPDKTTPGNPTQYWFDAQVLPTITLWQVPDSTEPRMLKFYRARQIQDAVLPDGLQPEVPFRFLDAYVAGLSWRVAVHYAPASASALKQLAKEAFDTAKNRDVEKSSLRIVPAMSIYTNAVYQREDR
jgi:hypothetical protein